MGLMGDSLGISGHAGDLLFCDIHSLLGHPQSFRLHVQQSQLLGHFNLGDLEVSKGLEGDGKVI